MQYREAFQPLGLDPNASADEIQQAYHKLAKTDHPDSDGYHRLMVSLNEARDVAISHGGNTQLVPINLVHELARTQERAVARVEQRAERRGAVERNVRSLIRYQTSRFIRRKRTVQAVAYAGSGATALTGLLRAVALTGLDTSESIVVADSTQRQLLHTRPREHPDRQAGRELVKVKFTLK